MDSTISPDTRFDIIDFNHLSPEAEWHRLGAGSFGSVYRADYLGLPVAVKEIFSRTDYNVEKYFARECKILQEARHPNIVQYIGLCLAPPGLPKHDYQPDSDEEDNAPPVVAKKGGLAAKRILIISEYLPKGNLRGHLLAHATGPTLSWRLRLSFAIDITRSIAYLHERRCLHRDLKLENCLITDNFRIKLCDFGFARLEAKNDEEVRRLSYCGTDGYMSPEILRGEPFGLATDIYSLGILFCELITLKLTGQAGSSTAGFLERVPPAYSIKPADLKALLCATKHGCPDGFIQLALKCSDTDSSQRPPIRTVLRTLDQIERQVVTAEAETIANAAKAAARAGAAAPKGLVDRLVKMDCVGSFSFGSGKVEGNLANPGETVLTSKRSRSGHPKRIPSFGGQIVVPHTEKPSEVDSDEESDESSDDDEDRPSLVEVQCLLKTGGHPTTSSILEGSGSSTPSVASTIRPHTILKSQLSDTTLMEGVPAESSSSNRVEPEPIVASGSVEKQQYISTSAGNSSIPSNIGTIKTVLSDSSSRKMTEDTSFLKEPSTPTSLAAAPLVEEEEEEVLNETTKVPTPSSTSNINDNARNDPNVSIIEQPLIPAATVTADQDVQVREKSPVKDLEDHSTNVIEPAKEIGNKENIEPTMDALLAASNPIKSGPHRFTLFKTNWLTHLFSKSSNTGASGDPPRRCGACQKKISMLKTFLECDDCGMKCHHKCSDLSSLPNCAKNSKGGLISNSADVV